MLISEYIKEEQKFIKIQDDSFEVELCDLGASIFAIRLDGHYMTQTPIEEQYFVVKRAFAGKTVGRFANRIKGNVITIEGKKYTLLDNEKGNVLHGGVEGLSTKTFNYQIEQGNDFVKVVFSYLSKDGESGFPGNLLLKVIYTVFKGKNELRMEYVATTDKTTCCALTNHAYFTVGERSLKNTKLLIKASNYLHCNPVDLIPIEKREVTSFLDFRKLKPIMEDINNPILKNSKANGYDHHYYFDNLDENELKAELVGKEYKMSIYTDFSGLQIYSSNFVNPVPQRGLDMVMHNSLAVEPQDDFLHLRLLKPGEKYTRFVIYKFSRIGK